MCKYADLQEAFSNYCYNRKICQYKPSETLQPFEATYTTYTRSRLKPETKVVFGIIIHI